MRHSVRPDAAMRPDAAIGGERSRRKLFDALLEPGLLEEQLVPWPHMKSVISLLESDDEEEKAMSRRRTKERREERRLKRQREADGWLHPEGPITCPVCFCEIDAGDACLLASCSHSFCIQCISTFVRGKIEDGEVCRSLARSQTYGAKAPNQMGCTEGRGIPGFGDGLIE